MSGLLRECPARLQFQIIPLRDWNSLSGKSTSSHPIAISNNPFKGLKQPNKNYAKIWLVIAISNNPFKGLKLIIYVYNSIANIAISNNPFKGLKQNFYRKAARSYELQFQIIPLRDWNSFDSSKYWAKKLQFQIIPLRDWNLYEYAVHYDKQIAISNNPFKGLKLIVSISYSVSSWYKLQFQIIPLRDWNKVQARKKVNRRLKIAISNNPFKGLKLTTFRDT